MPHVIVKLVPGPSEAQKQELAEQITQSIVTVMGKPAETVSVSIEEIEKEDWPEVYKADIMGHQDLLYKKPGYTL